MRSAAYHEPLHVTLLRTGIVGLGVGLVVARIQHRPGTWPQWTAFALWFSFGGHWVEVFFLNWLRPRLAAARWVQITGRVVTWIVGGTLLMIGARLTMPMPPWWFGGPFLLGLELLVHALPPLRGHPNFYNGLQ